MEYVICVENLKKSFKKRVLFENVNLKIKKGSCVALIGQNGSGKSVFFKILTGFVCMDQGCVYIREEKLGEKREFPEGVGVLINSPVYLENESGLENLTFLAGIRKQISKEHVIEVMKQVGLDADDSTKVKHYSMGMRKKLGIAQAIMEGQDIIILDEPFNELDYKSKAEIFKIIKKLKEDGKTILLTSHNFNDIEQLSDQKYIIKDKTIQLMLEKDVSA